MKNTFFILICLWATTLQTKAQTYGSYNHYAQIDFEDGTGSDVLKNASCSLQNEATVITDAERGGKVMQFTAANKGNLQFTASPLNNQMTISLWFKRQDTDASACWRMIFAFYGADGSCVYLTPLTSWNTNAYLVYDNKPYNIYKTVAANTISNETWVHLAVVFDNNNISVYQNGELASSSKMLTQLMDVNANQWYFGNYPANNFSMSGCLDDINIYHSALAANQIKALMNNEEIPAPADNEAVSYYVQLPLDNDLSDTQKHITITDYANVSFVSDEKKGNVAQLGINGYINIPSEALGSDKFSIPFLFKKESFTQADSGKFIIRFAAENDDYIGVKTIVNGNNVSLQLVKSESGTETVLTTSGTKYIQPQEWNSINFVQTYSAQGTAAVRVYLNNLSALLKTKTDIQTMNCKTICFGDNSSNGLTFLLDECRIYQYELSAAERNNYENTQLNPLSVTVDVAQTYQTICNFGSSDAWTGAFVGKYFAENKRNDIAEKLFSLEMDEEGNPKGIGLSAWRFNIGAGTSEQGDNSRISVETRRSECFLNSDGTYDWTKQSGQQFFLQKAAKTYSVPDIIGWQNSPPVYYTKRGLGFREYGDAKETILSAEHYDDFGNFLAEVILHFKEEGININYISPLNEPQWDWSASSANGTVSQEGTPWTNPEIKKVVNAISEQFMAKNVNSKLFVTEAGSIPCLLQGTGVAYNQLANLWSPGGANYMGQPTALSNIVSSHSYFTDGSANALVENRQTLKDRLTALGDYQYWQTEYSLLSTGYRFGHSSSTLTPMECGISLARVIHNDLAVGNATGWQWWTTFELESKLSQEERFALIRVAFNSEMTDGIYRESKLLYTLGNYSRFVRPGMKRIAVDRSDNATDIEAVSSQMISAYYDETTQNVVMVVVNASTLECGIKLEVNNLPNNMTVKDFSAYITSDEEADNLRYDGTISAGIHYIMPGTSVATFVGKAEAGNSKIDNPQAENLFSIYPNPANQQSYFTCHAQADMQISIVDLLGKTCYSTSINEGDNHIPANNLEAGIYMVYATRNNQYVGKSKLIIGK